MHALAFIPEVHMLSLPRRLVILGPQGAGKGTQAEALCGVLGATHIASGDAIRAEIRKGTELGGTLQRYTTTGQLVPDDLVLDLVNRALQPAPAWILDGYPRTEAQARALDAILEGAGVRLDAVLALEAPDDILIERIRGRIESQSTGKDYHVKFNPPPPSDPGPFIRRADDTPEAITERLSIYHRATEPLETYYESRGILHRIDAAPSVQAVTCAVLQSLGIAEAVRTPQMH
jgi:adenylate kinase